MTYDADPSVDNLVSEPTNMQDLDEGFIAGYACLSARSDLLDRINVFPVADGDTGANLRISLGPLRSCRGQRALAANRLYRTATGNSGNIAASFFAEFLQAEIVTDLADKADKGRQKAWQAVAEPKTGTMLSVFDTLAEALTHCQVNAKTCATILDELQAAVSETASTLPDLRTAGVVDSGALAIFVFFDGFFRALTGYQGNIRSLADLFPGRLSIAAGYHPKAEISYCVDALLKPANGVDFDTQTAASLGKSVVVLPDHEQVKIHLHTSDPQALRKTMTQFGDIVAWSDESMVPSLPLHANHTGSIHIMTDAAGSLSRDMARQYGMTLLDSYIVSGDTARPESLCSPQTIYTLMRNGEKVTTAQASLFERHQLYKSVCEEHGDTLYLCVGSAFTGNFAAALNWKNQHDPAGHLSIIDTGAASGRLAVIALLTARYANEEDAAKVVSCARLLVENCKEYVFIDVLRYLVAGGRVSQTSGFFGDLLRMKPVISPTPAGVRKVGVVRSPLAQIAFAEEKLRQEKADGENALILLQYSDNEDWVMDVVQARIQAVAPDAEIIVGPLSLTSGVHMGPGTWSIAFAKVP